MKSVLTALRGRAKFVKINSRLPPRCQFPERVLPRLRCKRPAVGGGPLMEKLVLLCVIIGIIGVLAEFLPAARPQK
jgi:hypothetical protein